MNPRGRALDALVVDARVPESDILTHVVGEQVNVLLNVADSPAEVVEIPLPHVQPVHKNPTAGDIVEAGQQLRDGRFSGARGIDNERVEGAAARVHADGFIEKLRGGYEEDVRERGNNFSTGQRQLLSFARALSHRPEILVLDEATSSVDTETEELIQDAVEKLQRNRTSLVIAHRLSTIENADRILVLHHGQLRENGTHAELIARPDGVYAKLYRLQREAEDKRRAHMIR